MKWMYLVGYLCCSAATAQPHNLNQPSWPAQWQILAAGQVVPNPYTAVTASPETITPNPSTDPNLLGIGSSTPVQLYPAPPTPRPGLPAQLQFRRALTSPAAQFAETLLREAYKRLSIDVRFVDIPFGRSLLESNKGTLDGEIARVFKVTEHYPNLEAVPYVLFDTEVYLYINQQRCPNCTLETVDSLAYVRGALIVEELLQHLPASRHVIGSGAIDTTKELFLTGKVDAVLFAAYRLSASSHFEYDEQHLASLPDYHLLHRRHRALLLPLAQELLQLEQEGFTERLRHYYGVAAPRRQLTLGEPAFKQYDN